MTKITKRLYDRLVEIHGKKHVDKILQEHKITVHDEWIEDVRRTVNTSRR